jgi:hypothetical protein
VDVATTDLFSWLAEHIRGSGRDVVGVAILVNANRMPDIVPTKFNVNRIRQRFGDVIRDELGIEPAALTAAEAAYLLNFQDAQSLRARAAKARGERDDRLRRRVPPEEERAEQRAELARLIHDGADCGLADVA